MPSQSALPISQSTQPVNDNKTAESQTIEPLAVIRVPITYDQLKNQLKSLVADIEIALPANDNKPVEKYKIELTDFANHINEKLTVVLSLISLVLQGADNRKTRKAHFQHIFDILAALKNKKDDTLDSIIMTHGRMPVIKEYLSILSKLNPIISLENILKIKQTLFCKSQFSTFQVLDFFTPFLSDHNTDDTLHKNAIDIFNHFNANYTHQKTTKAEKFAPYLERKYSLEGTRSFDKYLEIISKLNPYIKDKMLVLHLLRAGYVESIQKACSDNDARQDLKATALKYQKSIATLILDILLAPNSTLPIDKEELQFFREHKKAVGNVILAIEDSVERERVRAIAVNEKTTLGAFIVSQRGIATPTIHNKSVLATLYKARPTTPDSSFGGTANMFQRKSNQTETAELSTLNGKGNDDVRTPSPRLGNVASNS